MSAEPNPHSAFVGEVFAPGERVLIDPGGRIGTVIHRCSRLLKNPADLFEGLDLDNLDGWCVVESHIQMPDSAKGGLSRVIGLYHPQWLKRLPPQPTEDGHR